MGQRVQASRFHLKTKQEEETHALGVKVGGVLPPGSVVALDGDLGAGKTVMARGLSQGLGVRDLESVTSPTFTLLNEYDGKRPVAHFDFYRVETINSLPEMGFEEALSSGATVIAEWAAKFPGAFPADRTLWVQITPRSGDPEAREIEVMLPEAAGAGDVWAPVRRALKDW